MRSTFWAVLAIALFACGGGGSSTKPSDAVGAGSTFSGTLSDGAILRLALSTPTAGLRGEAAVAVSTWPLAITGTLVPTAGPSIDITGGFDPDGKSFMISGGGYFFNGSYASNTLTATGTGPGGDVTLIAYRSDDAAVTVFCGTWQLGSDSGTFNMVVRGTDISGTASGGATFTGTVTGTSFTVDDHEGSVASGTISGAGESRTVAGTITNLGSPAGTFSGSFCQ